ncbi:MOSC domain-containing protein [Bisporella sp. PMI_857]|nr:MOSC domain-containing protein [Bisporella sp. PMI_857]
MSVLSVARSSDHKFHKDPADSINLLEGLGVEGDCHLGVTVQHRSRLHIRPPPPNLRQVHLIHAELFSEFLTPNADGAFKVLPGQLGENITTKGIDLLALSTGTKLHFLNEGKQMGDEHAVVRVCGVRNPCPQIDKFQKGLKERCLVRDRNRNVVGRKAGIMGVVDTGGKVERRARIVVEAPEIFEALECV